jgi:hypothetical protein
MQSYQIII